MPKVLLFSIDFHIYLYHVRSLVKMPVLIHFENDLMGFGWSFWDFIWFNLGIRGYKIHIENWGSKMLSENWGSRNWEWDVPKRLLRRKSFKNAETAVYFNKNWFSVNFNKNNSQSIKITYYDKNQTIQSLRTRSMISFSFILLAKISKNILLVKTKLLLISQETFFWSENKAKKETAFFLRIFYKNSSKERMKEFHS